MSGAATLFLAFDSINHILRPASLVAATKASGMDPAILLPIGILLLVLLILFVIPRTAFMGALLITGYLGGAVAANIITGALPLFLGIGLPVVTAIFLWSGLYVASPRLRDLLKNKINS